MKFVHAADIHLDSPLRGLERYEGAPVDEIRGATRRALQNLVDLVIDQRADFLLIAGDLYDGDWQDHNTGLFFVLQMSRLREAGVPVVLIRGNHDAQSKMTRSLRLPDNVQMLSARRAESSALPKLAELGVAVHGRSYAEQEVKENLAAQYPEARSGCFNIGLLHTSLDGREGHEPYAPCTLDDLRGKGYDYWALGHVHTREIICEEPFIGFPGNVQGRHIREPSAKGCFVVDVDSRHNVDVRFEPLDVLRWQECRVDATRAADGDEVLERFTTKLDALLTESDGLPLAVRVTIEGACAAHQHVASDIVQWTSELRGAALDRAARRVWIEKVKLRTRPQRDLHEFVDADGPVGELVAHLHELRADPEALAQLAGQWDELSRKLPDELFQGQDGMKRLDDSEWLRELAAEVEPLLISRLLGEEAPS
jgi:DNA repair exonuclease SbcCD nuclease subunit